MTQITEIAPDIYRISTFILEGNLQFNQFLVRDEQPLLFHTGMKGLFPVVRDAVATLLPPASIRWIGFSHFEPDECGALNEWLRIAPRAQAVSSVVGSAVMLDDFADRPARPLADEEVLGLGRHRLRFLSTPHVPHAWDAGLFFEETDRTLLCSDLFFHGGDPEPLTESDIVARARAAILQGIAGPMPKDMPFTPYTESTLARLAALGPSTLAVMHGSSFRGDGRTALLELSAVVKELLG